MLTEKSCKAQARTETANKLKTKINKSKYKLGQVHNLFGKYSTSLK